MVFPRVTVANVVTLSGRGLHTGRPVTLKVHPGDQGISFRLGSSRWRAIPENVTDTTRSTRLGDVGTIEHLMSAFAGLEITDAEVELDAPELPGMDGSAKPFVDALREGKLAPVGADLVLPSLFRRLFLGGEGGPASGVSKGQGHWKYVYSTGPRWPGEQAFEALDVVDAYADQIAPARTFALSEEVEAILKMGLAQGLDESSALILGTDGYMNTPRFPDEPARHKLLDLIGDLYLAGIPVRALNVVAERTGHKKNVELAGMLSKAISKPEC